MTGLPRYLVQELNVGTEYHGLRYCLSFDIYVKRLRGLEVKLNARLGRMQ